MAEEPKRPVNAYWLFLAENRGVIVKEAGTGAAGPVGKLAGERWKAMSDANKKPFVDKAAALKAQYEIDLVAFKAAGGVVGKRRAEKAEAKKEKENKRARRAAKDPNKPKKPVTAYWIWLGENRAKIVQELGKNDVAAVGKAAGAKWNALPSATKAPFETKAKELRAHYEKDIEEWKKRAAGNATDDGDDDEVEEESN